MGITENITQALKIQGQQMRFLKGLKFYLFYEMINTYYLSFGFKKPK